MLDSLYNYTNWYGLKKMKGRKMNKKFQDRWYVERELKLTPKRLDRAIKIMRKRHPAENWIYIRIPNNNQRTEYLSLEFVEWLKEVYLVNDKYYLDLEIAFYEKLVNKLELALNIPHNEIRYYDMSKKEMMEFFNKDLKSIDMAISKMCHRYNKDMKYIEDGIIFIKAEGVKYINEKYYRKGYLKELEEYKRTLDKK